MSIIVTDDGFGPDDLETGGARRLSLDAMRETNGGGDIALDIPNDVDPNEVSAYFDRVSAIVIAFPSFADGRGFSLARQLRQAGYTGRLRASGHVIADQYAHARRVGFDEVEIGEELAARQPEAQWRSRADWRAHDYQKRLQATA